MPSRTRSLTWPNSTKTGQDDETESRKTSKKEYIISNWFQRKKLHSNFGRLAKEWTHKLKPTLETLHAWVVGWVGGCQAMSDGKRKVNLELLTWPETPTHSSPYSQPRVRRTFSASFVPQPAENHTYHLFAGFFHGKFNAALYLSSRRICCRYFRIN